MEFELKPFWRKFVQFNWKFGLFLVLIVCIPRFIWVMHANTTGNYGTIGAIMLISAIVPFIFLTRVGRKKIGITKPTRHHWLLIAFVSGLIFSFLLYYIGQSLYGNSIENWYQYIGRSYKIPEEITRQDKTVMFVIFAFTGMIFSPIGEELYFRGIVHGAFEKSLGESKASIIDGAAFSLVHLSHFGLVYSVNRWNLLPIPALIWVLSMFVVSLLFYFFRKYSGSIAGAIICHAAFNLGMIYCIFYLL